MTRPTRVIVADDSAVSLKALTGCLGRTPGIDIVGTARNGAECLAALAAHHPDVLVLDHVMPDMSGLQVLERIRIAHPALPVIMFSSFTREGTSVTAEALALGAAACLAKPSMRGGPGSDPETVLKQLASQVLAVSQGDCALPARASMPPPPPVAIAPPPRPAGPVGASGPEALVIGSSTGGPDALFSLFSRLPADLPVPVLVVQHMPAGFTQALAQRLDASCPLRVAEAAGGERPVAGEVWVAPGGRHLEIERDAERHPVLRITDGPKVNWCRPSVDVTLLSATRTWGAGLVTLILTGMGADGRDGCAAARAAGGFVLVQDEASSTVWGMPGAVYNAGLADAIHPLAELPEALVRSLRPRSSPFHAARRAAGISP